MAGAWDEGVTAPDRKASSTDCAARDNAAASTGAHDRDGGAQAREVTAARSVRDTHHDGAIMGAYEAPDTAPRQRRAELRQHPSRRRWARASGTCGSWRLRRAIGLCAVWRGLPGSIATSSVSGCVARRRRNVHRWRASRRRSACRPTFSVELLWRLVRRGRRARDHRARDTRSRRRRATGGSWNGGGAARCDRRRTRCPRERARALHARPPVRGARGPERANDLDAHPSRNANDW